MSAQHCQSLSWLVSACHLTARATIPYSFQSDAVSACWLLFASTCLQAGQLHLLLICAVQCSCSFSDPFLQILVC
jgi:hypothetical protein